MKISISRLFLIVSFGLLVLGGIALYALNKDGNSSSAATQRAGEAAIRRVTDMNQGKEPPVSQDGVRSHLLADKEAYQITFHDNTQSFLITVYGSPFDWARLAAEQEFLSLTGLAKEPACQVKVTVATPYFANPEQSGEIFGLSFCKTP